MHIKLNTWQTFALFLPFVAGVVLLNFPGSHNGDFQAYQANLAVANFLFVLGLTIIISYQTLLAFDFTSQCNTKSILFKGNALIPLLFVTLYLLYVIYLTFINPEYYNHKYNTGPLRKAGFRASGWVILFFLVHAFITFYFINNQFVAKKINAVADPDEQDQLRNDFLVPMKKLTKASVWVVAIYMLLTTLIDVITISLKKGH